MTEAENGNAVMSEKKPALSQNKPIVLVGGGGHASVLADILLKQGRDIVAVISPDDITQRSVFSGIPQLLSDTDIEQFAPDQVELVNGIGMLPGSGLREKLNRCYLAMGYQFATVVADSAQVSAYARLEPGVQVFSQALIQTGAVIGAHSIINSGALVEHDCLIGGYNHIAPRAVVCGQVTTAHNVYIGAGAVVLQNRVIGRGCILGAGAQLAVDLPDDMILYPAKSTVKPIQNKR